MFRRVPWTEIGCPFRPASASQDLSKGTRDLPGVLEWTHDCFGDAS